MKVAIITQYYPPEPVPIPHAIAHGLVERGHDVRVLTAYPNYPDGKLFAGYRQAWTSHENDGEVRVRRVPIYISHSRNPVGRLVNYVSFALSSLVAGGFVRNADVVYVYATQMTAAIAPSWWHRIRKTPFVLHVQDLWPESITGSSMVTDAGGFTRSVSVILSPWLRGLYRAAAATIGISGTMASMLTQRGGPVDRVHTVHNWAEETTAERDPIGRSSIGGADSRLSVVYAGNLGEMQDLETVVRAAAQVKDLPGFALTLVGAGVARQGLERLVGELRATNIEFRGRVHQSEMAEIYAASDFQMIPLKDLDIFRGTIPSKFQGSLANGVPVITTVAGDVSDLVRAHGVGLASAPGDVDALAATFRSAYAMPPEARREMGIRAQKYYESEMSMSSGINKIEEILVRAAGLSEMEKRND